MAKARASRKGPRNSGEGNGKSQRSGRDGAVKAKAPAASKAKPRRPAAVSTVPKAQVSRPRGDKREVGILVRADAVKARGAVQIAPIPVIPETPPPLPAPIASFTF
jgi:hypothetical protein